MIEDAGGPSAPYLDNENYTFTICPDVPGNVIYLTWFVFNLSTAGSPGNPADNLTIYDGDNTGATSLGTYTGTDLQNLIVSGTVFNTTGCLTLVWESNTTGVGDFSAGFQCTVHAEPHGCRPAAAPAAGRGYAPLPGGRLLAGATSQPTIPIPRVRDKTTRHNLDASRGSRPAPPVDVSTLDGRVGWRLQRVDRLPLVGAVPAAGERRARAMTPRFIRAQPGCTCSPRSARAA